MKQFAYLCAIYLTLVVSLPTGLCMDEKPTSPNIVIITADDLGYNDVSYHGSDQFFTPNIDSLGYQGLILNDYYSPSLSSGARASILTGKYPSRLGLQAASLDNDESAGLSQSEKLMPEYFQEAGYKTHLVGKWHLGFHQRVLSPTKRGFHHHFGPLGGHIDYFDYTHKMSDGSRGLDMRNDDEIYEGPTGIYATRLFGKKAVEIVKKHQFSEQPLFLMVSHVAPGANGDGDLQAPADVIERFQHIRNRQRRLFVEMTHVLDEEIGELIDALSEREILNNTVIVFIGTNGGMVEGHMRNSASNWPLRGQKMGPFEGGVRVAATVWSSKIQSRHRISSQLMHCADWLPTLTAMVGIESQLLEKNLDGMNLWPTLSANMPSPRIEILHTMNPATNSIVYLNSGWKFINGSQAIRHDGWAEAVPSEEIAGNFTEYFTSLNSSKTWTALQPFAETELSQRKVTNLRENARIICERVQSKIPRVQCKPEVAPCLFHIQSDPCEIRNMASIYPEILAQIRNQISQQHPTTIYPINVPGNTRSDPRYFNNTWTFWSDEIVFAEKFTRA
ncbi:hypothetical protein DMENIID0001_060770 [Sergentomyia squamirostris]